MRCAQRAFSAGSCVLHAQRVAYLIVSIYNKGMDGGIQRVTRQLVVLLAVLLDAYVRGEELHGYAIMKLAHLSGPSTYRNLDRLEDAHLVEVRWEDLPPGGDRPRR